MKIFLDTADVKVIKSWKATGILDGVTTNPTHMSTAGGSPTKTVLEICKLLPKGAISVEVTEKKPELVYKQAKAIAKLAKNVVVKVPCHRDYYEVINKLVKDKIKLNITLVFTLMQGMMMCKLGVKYISPFVGRLDDIDADGIGLVQDLRRTIDWYGYKTELLAASLRNEKHLHDAILAGADIVTIPPVLLEKATEYVLTTKGMKKFDDDWKKLGVSLFP